jgi:hypothetical protein
MYQHFIGNVIALFDENDADKAIYQHCCEGGISLRGVDNYPLLQNLFLHSNMMARE